MEKPTIGDLVASGCRLEIWCCRDGCRRQARWPPAEAVAKLGARTTFPEAARRLRCDACGARGREKMVTCRPDVVDGYEGRWARQT